LAKITAMATTLTFLLLNVLVIAPLGFRIMVGLNRRLSHLQAGVRDTTIPP
jgi:HAMP domain-containing protein